MSILQLFKIPILNYYRIMEHFQRHKTGYRLALKHRAQLFVTRTGLCQKPSTKSTSKILILLVSSPICAMRQFMIPQPLNSLFSQIGKMSDDEFEVQLAQEAAQPKDSGVEGDTIGEARTRTDPDGTVYEWDAQKGAWFPKIDEDFIAKYQMQYGSDVSTATTTTTAASVGTEASSVPSVTDPNYYQYYYSQYSTAGSGADTTATDSEAYRQWYNYYYGDQANAKSDKNSEIPPAPADINSEEYYNWYYTYYGQGGNTTEGTGQASTTTTTENTNGASKTLPQDAQAAAADNQGKGISKRKNPDPPSWFDVSEEKNTNVYISGLPPDMTDDEFKEFMNKCGLIMYDPITRKPKLKMYKDENGENKGDGRCCYIKPESVDLALQFLDGSEVRGHKIYVERAKFELKGKFDPSKRRRKLTKQERKKFQEKQQKLFDWRPDKPLGARNKNEKVVILKNMFDPKIFEADPTLVTSMRDKLKKECTVFGEVKKVVVYDRHSEGVVGVTFLSPEEADICIEGMNGRYYSKRIVTAATWDGKTKYVVEETEEEHQKRLNQWEEYLEDGDKSGKSGEKSGKSGDKPETTGQQPDTRTPGEADMNTTTCTQQSSSSSQGEGIVSSSTSAGEPGSESTTSQPEPRENDRIRPEQPDSRTEPENKDGSAHVLSSAGNTQVQSSEGASLVQSSDDNTDVQSSQGNT